MTECFYAFGTTLAGLTNIETVIDAPQVLDDGRIPLLPPIKTLSLDSFAQRNGKINVPLRIDVPYASGRIALNTLLFGDQTTASKELYASALDEFGFYSPYLVVVHRAYEQQDYALTRNPDVLQTLMLPCFDWRLQSATKTGNYTVTNSDAYLKGDTSGGSVTFTLPVLSGRTSDIVFSAHKVAATNSLILAKHASDGGGTYLTLTANGARADIAKINGVWATVRSGSMV